MQYLTRRSSHQALPFEELKDVSPDGSDLVVSIGLQFLNGLVHISSVPEAELAHLEP